MKDTKALSRTILEGPLLLPVIRYTVPIMLTSLLQLLYNSADMFVLGNFSGDPNAVGAVGCTGALINLIIGLFIGLGAGVCVTLGHALGSGDDRRVTKTVHTSIALAVTLGLIVTVIGFFGAPFFLELMGTTDVFIEGATDYVRIYFLGSVFNILYNFLAGLLRSMGDTLRPLIFSSCGGVLNIGLNILFVSAFDMGIRGVAIATIVSQAVSAILSLIWLSRIQGPCRFSPKKLGIDRVALSRFLRYGIPAGIQGCLFSFSNVLLQSAYNSLGTVFVNANAAANNVDAYLYNILNAFYHTSLTFASQNYGAGNFKRIRRIFAVNCVTVTAVGLSLGALMYLFASPLISIFNSDPEVIAVGTVRLLYVCVPYFLCGIMEQSTAFMRAIGHSVLSTVITFIGSCALRIVWIYTVFRAVGSMDILYTVYPVSWAITFVAATVAFFICLRRRERDFSSGNFRI